jgi:hypothetical protein
MRKLIVIFALVFTFLIASAPAFAAEQHPPKFGVHDSQCQADPNQPQCPGNH